MSEITGQNPATLSKQHERASTISIAFPKDKVVAIAKRGHGNELLDPFAILGEFDNFKGFNPSEEIRAKLLSRWSERMPFLQTEQGPRFPARRIRGFLNAVSYTLRESDVEAWNVILDANRQRLKEESEKTT